MNNGKHEAEVETPTRDHFLSNGAYDFLKFQAQIFLPALGTLYFALASIWNLPAGEQVIGTITSVDAFLGVLLGISTSSYKKSEAKYDGALNIDDTSEDKTIFQFDVSTNPDVFEHKKEVVFKVNKLSP